MLLSVVLSVSLLHNPLVAFGAGAVAATVVRETAARLRPVPSTAVLSKIVARPGPSQYGVGLLCVQPVPAGGRVCGCEPVNSVTVPLSRLRGLPTEVRTTIHELYDGVDEPPGTCCVPTDYEQAIPLISFINHSDDPSCAYDEEQHAILATRPLRVGDEATVDYFAYRMRLPTPYHYLAHQSLEGYLRCLCVGSRSITRSESPCTYTHRHASTGFDPAFAVEFVSEIDGEIDSMS